MHFFRIPHALKSSFAIAGAGRDVRQFAEPTTGIQWFSLPLIKIKNLKWYWITIMTIFQQRNQCEWENGKIKIERDLNGPNNHIDAIFWTNYFSLPFFKNIHWKAFQNPGTVTKLNTHQTSVKSVWQCSQQTEWNHKKKSKRYTWNASFTLLKSTKNCYMFAIF